MGASQRHRPAKFRAGTGPSPDRGIRCGAVAHRQHIGLRSAERLPQDDPLTVAEVGDMGAGGGVQIALVVDDGAGVGGVEFLAEQGDLADRQLAGGRSAAEGDPMVDVGGRDGHLEGSDLATIEGDALPGVQLVPVEAVDRAFQDPPGRVGVRTVPTAGDPVAGHRHRCGVFGLPADGAPVRVAGVPGGVVTSIDTAFQPRSVADPGRVSGGGGHGDQISGRRAEIDLDRAEALVAAEPGDAGVEGVIGLSGQRVVVIVDPAPQALLGELDDVVVDTAEEHRAEPAIAQWQCLGLPVDGRSGVPQAAARQRWRGKGASARGR